MRVRVTGGVGDLARDCRKVATGARKDMVGVVREGIKTGNVVARDLARESAGSHGKHYPKAFSSEMTLHGALGLIAGEYGPDASKPQGGMSFEGGSRNQPAHNDLAKSADLIGPAFRGEVRRLPERWFWPGAE